MKTSYRHMMEQVSMGKETKAAMLETIMETRQPRRSIRPVQTALIAACVCVMLVGTALAAQVIWGVRLEDKQQGNPGYFVSADLPLWPVEQLSEELRKDADDFNDFGIYELELDSWERVEDYFNVPLIGNEMLTAPVSPVVCLHKWENGSLYECDANAGYIIDNAQVNWKASLYTEEYSESGGDVPLFTLGGNAEDEVSYSQYQMKNGAQAQIAKVTPGEIGATVPMYYTYFVRDGVFYTLEVDCRPVDDRVAGADYEQLLYKILDAFE